MRRFYSKIFVLVTLLVVFLLIGAGASADSWCDGSFLHACDGDTVHYFWGSAASLVGKPWFKRMDALGCCDAGECAMSVWICKGADAAQCDGSAPSVFCPTCWECYRRVECYECEAFPEPEPEPGLEIRHFSVLWDQPGYVRLGFVDDTPCFRPYIGTAGEWKKLASTEEDGLYGQVLIHREGTVTGHTVAQFAFPSGKIAGYAPVDLDEQRFLWPERSHEFFAR